MYIRVCVCVKRSLFWRGWVGLFVVDLGHCIVLVSLVDRYVVGYLGTVSLETLQHSLSENRVCIVR